MYSRREESVNMTKDDISDVRRQEERRGRRPIDLEARKQSRKQREACRTYLYIATEEEFVNAMRALGIREDSPAFLKALAAWREFPG